MTKIIVLGYMRTKFHKFCAKVIINKICEYGLPFNYHKIDDIPRPKGRMQYGICCNNNIVYIFGGETDVIYFNDLWSINLNNIYKMNWIELK